MGVEIGAAAMKTRMEVPQKIKKQNYHAILAYTQTKILIKKDTCTPVFTGTRFTIAKTWNQPKCLSTDDCIKKIWDIFYTYMSFIFIKRMK